MSSFANVFASEGWWIPLKEQGASVQAASLANIFSASLRHCAGAALVGPVESRLFTQNWGERILAFELDAHLADHAGCYAWIADG